MRYLRTCLGLLAAFSGLGFVSAQTSLSLSLTTSTVSVTTTTRSGGQSTQIITAVPTTFNVTYTYTSTPTSTSSEAASETATPTPTPEPIVLDTKLDPAFGVLGALLILTGLPSAFWGHKNRWTSFFLIGFYTLSLVCIVLILKFGVLPAVNPPSKTLRGMFVLASAIAGIAGGGIAIFFWKASRYCIGAWGGFAFALWIQCFHNGGIIKPIGLRWIMYIACAVVGFVLCTIPKIHYHILLISTAFVGSSAFMLGVDCFTTAGLKEFYVWNLGFTSLFPKFKNNGIQFPVSQTMQIELGLIGATCLMGAAVQLRILGILQRKLKEIAEEQKKRDEEAEIQASEGFSSVLREREQWEKAHLSKHGRNESGFSSMMPLMKDRDGSTSPGTPDNKFSDFSPSNESRPRRPSGVSDFQAAPTSEDELARAARGKLQNPGALPTLDLGLGIQEDVPQSFMARRSSPQKDVPLVDPEELKRKQALEAEIETIRRSIDALKSETPAPSSSGGSRRPSMTSRRTLSVNAESALLPPPNHTRPPREVDPRARVRSMDMSALTHGMLGESIGRPTSAPLRDNEWDTYVQERKLLQPPAGVTPPIATTSIAPQTSSRIQMPPAVADALSQRRRRESALARGGEAGSRTDSSEDIPLSRIRHKKNSSSGGHVPVTILPPRRTSGPIVAPTPQRPNVTRTRTFEELNERHREKMRDLQAPLSHAEKEHADLEAAKQRWERSKALERDAVTRRQAEKAALLEKRKKSSDAPERTDRKSLTVDGARKSRHSRSLSADKLASMSSSSKRVSTMKVEDWQKYQEMEGGPQHERGSGGGTGGSKRDSRVPFPDGREHRRKSRDPPN